MVPGPTVSLPARQLFEIPDAASVRVLCTSGCLWLTLDNDPRDIVLHPGDSFDGTRSRRALIYAFEPSTFLLAVPAPGCRVQPGTPRARVLHTPELDDDRIEPIDLRPNCFPR